jgi:threonine synthase
MLRSRRNPDNSFYFEPRSGDRYPLDIPRWCADGPKPLLISPQPGIGRDEIDRGTRSLWRYQASLPVEISKPISIGEGCTPLVQKEWGDFRPFFKLEWFNPTCSFKDRGTTVMLSYLRQLGIDAEKLNPFGGAIALGHPFGMTGARIMTTLLNDLDTLDAQFGIEPMCVAGGMGQAMLVERLN